MRAYRLPYEDTETYQRSIEIIAALNSKTQLRRLISLYRSAAGSDRAVAGGRRGRMVHSEAIREAKASLNNILMKHLAPVYHVCKSGAPHDGVRGNVEEMFEEKSKYEDAFDEREINKELGNNHVVVNYITAWVLHNRLTQMRSDLPRRDEEFCNSHAGLCWRTSTTSSENGNRVSSNMATEIGQNSSHRASL